jgi:hypothetical protein
MVLAGGCISGYLYEAAMGCVVGHSELGLSAIHSKEVPVFRRSDTEPSYAAS